MEAKLFNPTLCTLTVKDLLGNPDRFLVYNGKWVCRCCNQPLNLHPQPPAITAAGRLQKKINDF
jgi:hypothetical protein